MSNVSRRNFLKAATAGAIGTSAIATQALAAGETILGAVVGDNIASDGADWLGQPPAIADADCVETVECEVLVVGAGCSGTFAACHAAEAGAKVCWIEATATGNGVRSSALAAIDTKAMKAVGCSINKNDICNDIAHYALNQCDIRFMYQWAENSAEAIDWYADMVEPEGYVLCPEYGMPQGETRYKMWPTGHGTAPAEDTTKRVTDSNLLYIFTDHVEELGGEFRTETRMQRLIQDEAGKVVGAYATNPDGAYIRINASKGVIIATGGYVNNGQMYTALQGDLARGLAGGLNHGTAFGEGIKACLWAGAKLQEIPTTMVFDRGVVKPGTELGHMYEGPVEFKHFTFATQPFLKVCKKGTRLTNESSPYDFILHAGLMNADPAWYPIWDSSWLEDVQRFQTIGCSTLFLREGSNNRPATLEATQTQMESMVENGFIIKADTIRELGEGLLLDDVDAFVAEVENYNAMVAAGVDTQFGKDAFRLSAIDEPPYYGMRVGGEPLCTLDGIYTNLDFQALDAQRNPIEGLYVIGNDQGGYYAHTYPNFGAGTNAGRIATAGMLCGRIVAGK